MKYLFIIFFLTFIEVSGQQIHVIISTEWNKSDFSNFSIITYCDSFSNSKRFDSRLLKDSINNCFAYKSYCNPDSLINIKIVEFWPRMNGIFLTKEEFENLYYLDFFFYRKRKWLKRFIYIRTTATFMPGYKKISESSLQKIRATKSLWDRWDK